MYMSFSVVGDFHFDQFSIFAKFAKFAGFTRGPSCLLICIGLQVVGDFDQFAIFAIFAKFARFAGFTRGPSCLLICIGLQVVVGEILPFLPFLLLCAFLDISPMALKCQMPPTKKKMLHARVEMVGTCVSSHFL